MKLDPQCMTVYIARQCQWPRTKHEDCDFQRDSRFSEHSFCFRDSDVSESSGSEDLRLKWSFLYSTGKHICSEDQCV